MCIPLNNENQGLRCTHTHKLKQQFRNSADSNHPLATAIFPMNLGGGFAAFCITKALQKAPPTPHKVGKWRKIHRESDLPSWKVFLENPIGKYLKQVVFC